MEETDGRHKQCNEGPTALAKGLEEYAAKYGMEIPGENTKADGSTSSSCNNAFMEYVADDLAKRLGAKRRSRRRADDEEDGKETVGSSSKPSPAAAMTFENIEEEEIDEVVNSTPFVQKKGKEVLASEEASMLRRRRTTAAPAQENPSTPEAQPQLQQQQDNRPKSVPPPSSMRLSWTSEALWPPLDPPPSATTANNSKKQYGLFEIAVLSIILVLAVRGYFFASEESLYWGSKLLYTLSAGSLYATARCSGTCKQLYSRLAIMMLYVIATSFLHTTCALPGTASLVFAFPLTFMMIYGRKKMMLHLL